MHIKNEMNHLHNTPCSLKTRDYNAEIQFLHKIMEK